MLRLGEKQNLRVIKEVEFGLYLASDKPATADERVMLPIKQRPPGIGVGDHLNVFIYRDSEDRLIATINEPLIKLGEVARLRVGEVSRIGAFLEWGLEKDLFLPFREQTRPISVDEQIVVALYIDKSDRLAATMKLYHYLKSDSSYHRGQTVSGEIYEVSKNFGAFVVVDDRYSALIPPREAKNLKVGDTVTAKVAFIKPDGKLDLSFGKDIAGQISADAEQILAIITNEYDATLPFSDKAAPEQIRTVFKMSKNEFKRAVGNLLKAGKIAIGEGSITVLCPHSRPDAESR